jgi:hypothetical protein
MSERPSTSSKVVYLYKQNLIYSNYSTNLLTKLGKNNKLESILQILLA